MRIYTMHKGEFVMVIVAFFALFGLGVFIGLAGKLLWNFVKVIDRITWLPYGPLPTYT